MPVPVARGDLPSLRSAADGTVASVRQRFADLEVDPWARSTRCVQFDFLPVRTPAAIGWEYCAATIG